MGTPVHWSTVLSEHTLGQAHDHIELTRVYQDFKRGPRPPHGKCHLFCLLQQQRQKQREQRRREERPKKGRRDGNGNPLDFCSPTGCGPLPGNRIQVAQCVMSL